LLRPVIGIMCGTTTITPFIITATASIRVAVKTTVAWPMTGEI
jgi:hypothetical protein